MEELGEGVQLDKLDYSPVPGNPITLALVMEIFLLDSLIYLLIAIYIENVFPGKINELVLAYIKAFISLFFVIHFFAGGKNVGLPFYYFLTKTYWRGHNSKKAPIKTRENLIDNRRYN